MSTQALRAGGWVAGVVTAVLLSAGCGARDAGDHAARSSTPPAGSATLAADGSVPWADSPVDMRYFNHRPARRGAKAGDRHCRATDLTGHVEGWTTPGTAGEQIPGAKLGPSKRIGDIRVRNRSNRECTLQGEVDARLSAAGRQVSMLYTHHVTAAAAERVTAVPPGQEATLRVDWDGPFCAELPAPVRLEIPIPHGGGRVSVPVDPAAAPPCARSETHPELTASLSTSPFDEVPAAAGASALATITAVLTAPATAAPGTDFSYTVALTNPTSRPIPLRPCPGYLQELFSEGSADANGTITAQAVNDAQMYLLNCRPVSQLPAHGTLRFTFVAKVPAALAPGRKLDVTWRLVDTDLVPDAVQQADFTLTVS